MADTNALAALAAALEQFDVPTYDALPEIDLYMDQVIGYLNRLLCRVCRSEDGAPLTPSMINNYVKGGHVERPVQKKYSRDRIAMLYMLCCLKQNLTISEAAALLGGEDTEALYARFRSLQTAALRSLSDAVPAAEPSSARPRCASRCTARRNACLPRRSLPPCRLPTAMQRQKNRKKQNNLHFFPHWIIIKVVCLNPLSARRTYRRQAYFLRKEDHYDGIQDENCGS